MIPHKTLISLVVLLAYTTATAQLAGPLKHGPYHVGFRTIDFNPDEEAAFSMCMWYPAERPGNAMLLSDYVETNMINGSTDKSTHRADFIRTFEIPYLLGVSLSSITQDQYETALASKTRASKDAVIKAGKWPVVICDTEPVSLVVTLEYLASHGFIVVSPAIQYGPPVNDETLYAGPTQGLETALNYIVSQSFVDPENISALGFGGGAMASFYVGMRTDKLKAFVNIEGGLFMPLSKTIYSKDYAPEKFTAPMLHIVNPQIRKGESDEQFNAVLGKKIRLTNNTPGMRHHDFTIYGRLVSGLLQMRGNQATVVTETFVKVHELILFFLENHTMNMASFPYLTIEEF